MKMTFYFIINLKLFLKQVNYLIKLCLSKVFLKISYCGTPGIEVNKTWETSDISRMGGMEIKWAE